MLKPRIVKRKYFQWERNGNVVSEFHPPANATLRDIAHQAICWIKWPITDWRRWRKDNNSAETLERIIDLVYSLPGGIDIEADENNKSPLNVVAHVGGLIYQICNAALEDLSDNE
jgi:hypothetical protein